MIDAGEHYRSVELSKMRKLMKYGPEQYKEDWDTAVAVSLLLADGREHLRPVLDSCMMRVLAYESNTETLPF